MPTHHHADPERAPQVLAHHGRATALAALADSAELAAALAYCRDCGAPDGCTCARDEGEMTEAEMVGEGGR